MSIVHFPQLSDPPPPVRQKLFFVDTDQKLGVLQNFFYKHTYQNIQNGLKLTIFFLDL